MRNGACRTAAAAAPLLLLLALPSPARAADADLGETGQLVIGVARLIPVVAVNSWSVQTSAPNDGPSGTQVNFGNHPSGLSVYDLPRLSLDWIPAGHLTVGVDFAAYATLGGTPSAGDSPFVSLVGVAPHVGYIAPLVGVFGVWLRAGVAYYVLGERGVDGTAASPAPWSFTWRQLDANVDAYLVITAFAHTAITAGVVAEVPVSGWFEERRPAGPGVDAAAGWTHVAVAGGILTYL
jgi:hypothetical protein